MTRTTPRLLTLVAGLGLAVPAVAGTVHPNGAPYTYSLPAGFAEVTTTAPDVSSAGAGSFRSGIAPTSVAKTPGVRDIITIVAYKLKVNADRFAPAALEAEAANVVAKLGPATVSKRRVQVAGRTAFAFVVRNTNPATKWDKARIIFVFKGKNEVFVNCQWNTHAREIQTGCATVLRTLKVA